jgi:aspartyl/glutamyl-tRNA(Asn/Gln) amidotransferase C subunit
LSLTPEEVKRIARLARVGLRDDEVAHFQVQLSEILDYFQRLR